MGAAGSRFNREVSADCLRQYLTQFNLLYCFNRVRSCHRYAAVTLTTCSELLNCVHWGSKKPKYYHIIGMGFINYRRNLEKTKMESMSTCFLGQLRSLSLGRTKLLDSVQSKAAASPQLTILLESSLMFHLAILFTTIFIVLNIFLQIKRLTLFTMHAVLMAIGAFFFLGEGMVSYRNKFLLESLSPIMQHSKRMKNRAIHQTIQWIGTGFMTLAILFIVASKVEHGHTIMPSSLHSLSGMIVISLIIIQVISGQNKIEHLAKHNSKIRRWHGDLGLLLWDIICVTVLLGVLQTITISFSLLLLILSIGGTWLLTHFQMRRKLSEMGIGGGTEVATEDNIEEEGTFENENP